jgi:hypothetical protein
MSQGKKRSAASGLYGATKPEIFVEGLQQKYAVTAPRVLLIKFGVVIGR